MRFKHALDGSKISSSKHFVLARTIKKTILLKLSVSYKFGSSVSLTVNMTLSYKT